jgi:hypothetical protein
MDEMREAFRRVAAIACILSGAYGCKGQSSAGRVDGAGGAAATGQNAISILNGFEGEIGIALQDISKNLAGAPDVVPISLQIKGDKVRAEVPQTVASKPMPKGYIVLSAPEKKLSFVMDEQKQIVVFDLNQTGEHLKSFGAGLPAAANEAQDKRPSKPPPKVTKTGVTDKAIGYDKSGAEQGRLELTKLEKKPLPPSLFEMPAGYKVVDLGAMMAQLGGALPGVAGIPFAIPPAWQAKKHK